MPILVQTVGSSVKVQEVAAERAYPQSGKKSRRGKTPLRESFYPRPPRRQAASANCSGNGLRLSKHAIQEFLAAAGGSRTSRGTPLSAEVRASMGELRLRGTRSTCPRPAHPWRPE